MECILENHYFEGYGIPMDELHEGHLDVIEEELCQVMHARYPISRMHICGWHTARQNVSPCEVCSNNFKS